MADNASRYFTYESRIASFQTSKSRMKWPHKWLPITLLALAGFFFAPTVANPDNVDCFLCRRSLDGWEKDDDPLAEHLKHSPDCGWAIVASIGKQHNELSEENPASERMVEARKATFSNLWPHEGKKGWKCKTKQMAEAGWKYTPTPEADDMATCTYCDLGLDGWEPSDKPMEEHLKRSPDCLFITLINKYKQDISTKKTRSKRERASKASRLSTQSVLTTASEAVSMTDLLAEEDDSILTTATQSRKLPRVRKGGAARKTRASQISNRSITPVMMDIAAEDDDSIITTATTATATQSKKMAKGKKTATTRKTRASQVSTRSAMPALEDDITKPKSHGRKTRARKDEPIEIVEPAGRTRGTKRKSDEALETANEITVYESVEAPPAKRISMGSHLSRTDLEISSQSHSMEDHPPQFVLYQSPIQRKKSHPDTERSSQSSDVENHPPKTIQAQSPDKHNENHLRQDESAQSSDAENHPPKLVQAQSPFKNNENRLRQGESSQSSDAENHPPKLLQFESPSKRNVITGGLKSSNPWTPVDLDTVMMNSPSHDIANSNDLFEMALERAKGCLTDIEKKMTVEQWIRYNAETAAQKLRDDCERMVSAFEREGARAMAAMEGIETY